MTPEQIVDVARETVWVMILIGAPTMLVALTVGAVISLLQALTQIQETTLAFVPKLIAVTATFVLTAPFVIAKLRDFSGTLFDRIIMIGGS